MGAVKDLLTRALRPRKAELVTARREDRSDPHAGCDHENWRCQPGNYFDHDGGVDYDYEPETECEVAGHDYDPRGVCRDCGEETPWPPQDTPLALEP